MLRLITAPTARPLTLPQVKDHLRVTSDAEDAYLDGLIEAVTNRYDGRDGILGRCLVDQTWDLILPEFADPIHLPLGPSSSITTVKYIDGDGTEQTLATSVYELIDAGFEPGYVRLKHLQTWPSFRTQSDAVRVRFVAGYATATAPGISSGIPQAIIHAMLLWIGRLYQHRELDVIGTIIQPVQGYEEALIAPYRIGWV
jgi:uncharacterized phiE125 gp8 family phage protein